MSVPTRAPAFVGALLVALGLGLGAPTAHAEESSTTTTAVTTITVAADAETSSDTTTSGTTSTGGTETVTVTAPAVVETDPTETTTSTTSTSTTTTTTTSAELPVPEITADECGMFADTLTVPESEGLHYVVLPPDPSFEALDLAPGTYPAVFLSMDTFGLEGDGTTYSVVIETRDSADGPALATTTLEFSLEPCVGAGVEQVVAEAECGAVTFTNPAGNPPALIYWGDPEAVDAEGEEFIGPGESVTVSTELDQIYWVALNAMDIPTDLPTDFARLEGDAAGDATGDGDGGPGWVEQLLVPEAASDLEQEAIGDPVAGVVPVGPGDIDPELIAELREFELSEVDLVLGMGDLEVPQDCTTTSTTTTPVLARTGSDGTGPLAGLSLGLLVTGTALVLGASGRVRLRRH